MQCSGGRGWRSVRIDRVGDRGRWANGVGSVGGGSRGGIGVGRCGVVFDDGSLFHYM